MNRLYIPKDYKISDWTSLEPFFIELKERDILSAASLYQWFLDRSELESVVSEDMAWRYINMTRDTENKEKTESFNYFVSEISPKIAPYSNALDTKALESNFLEDVKTKDGFPILIQLLEKDKAIYREQNVPLIAEVEQKAHQFGSISGKMTIDWEGKERTLQQAADLLLESDRAIRESAWLKIQERRYEDKDSLNSLYTELISIRHTISQNAGYANYRDYMFDAMGRFDYSKEACFQFHESIKESVVPILKEFALKRKDALGVTELKPWDLSVNYTSTQPLKGFEDGEDLVEKTIRCFTKIDPYLGDCISKMKALGHLDVMSRKGKAPGGYNYPLDETGIPFIFMNATQSLRDIVTMVHEGGHALHSFVTSDFSIQAFKHPTSEVAELASMSMELISMEYWEEFFNTKEDLTRAKKEHLESIIQTLPWVAIIDKFQHWVYENPYHTEEERIVHWNQISNQFAPGVVNWENLDHFKSIQWQKQLHLFEVPFYYIEYGFAQLGAIAVWKKYKENKTTGYQNYLKALQLGYTKSIPEIYSTAGIQFNFSNDYIKELMDFVLQEYKAL